MYRSEPRAAGWRRPVWVSALAVALGLLLMNANAAFAGGDHGWTHDSEGTPTSSTWGHDSDEGQPPSEGSDSGQSCEHPSTPPEETPPVTTPPEETPPYETPPETKPPEQTPPAETPPEHKPPEHKPPESTPPPEQTPPESKPPPEQTPPVETPPVETPPVETPPVETPPETTPPEYTPPETPTPVAPHKPSPPNETQTPNSNSGGSVLGQEEEHGGVVATPAPSAESTLPFTGVDIPLLMLMGALFLGVGLVLRRVSTE
jgi:hypothetical protein